MTVTVKEIDKKIEELRKEIAKLKRHNDWRSRVFIEELHRLVNQIERLRLKRNQTVWKNFGKEVRNKRRIMEVSKMDEMTTDELEAILYEEHLLDEAASIAEYEAKYESEVNKMEEKLPLLSWHRIPKMNQDDAEKYISTRMTEHYDGAWIIYLRYKYEYESIWTYACECANPGYPNEYDICWLNDWWEGQQDVEYIAMTEITECSISDKE